MARLVLRDGPNKGGSFAINKDELVIGSSASADIRIDDSSVSEQHAFVRRRGQRYMVQDCGSKRGTFVNGRKIERGELLDGALLRVGRLALQFVEERQPAQQVRQAQPGHIPGVFAAPKARKTALTPEDDLERSMGDTLRSVLADYKVEQEKLKHAKKFELRIPAKQTLIVGGCVLLMLALAAVFSLVGSHSHGLFTPEPKESRQASGAAPPAGGPARDIGVKFSFGDNPGGQSDKQLSVGVLGGAAGGQMGGSSNSNFNVNIEIQGQGRPPRLVTHQVGDGSRRGGPSAALPPPSAAGPAMPPSALNTGAPALPDLSGLMQPAGGAGGLPPLPLGPRQAQENPDGLPEEMSDEDRAALSKLVDSLGQAPQGPPARPAPPAPPAPAQAAAPPQGSVNLNVHVSADQSAVRLLSAEFAVSDDVLADSGLTAVLARPDGTFRVLWRGPGLLCSRAFHYSGTALEEEQRIPLEPGLLLGRHGLAEPAGGGLLLALHSVDQDGRPTILVRRYSSDNALLAELSVEPGDAAFLANPAVAAGADGSALLVWQAYGADGDGWGVYAQRLGPDGAPLGGSFLVNQYTVGDQGNPAAAVGADGEFAVAWASAGQDGDGCGVYARRYAADGAPLGDEFRVNSVCYWDQNWPAAALGRDGRLVLSWASFHQDRSSWGVFFRSFDSAGDPLGEESQVNVEFLGDQSWPCAALGPTGELMLAWSTGHIGREDWRVMARLFDAEQRARLVR